MKQSWTGVDNGYGDVEHETVMHQTAEETIAEQERNLEEALGIDFCEFYPAAEGCGVCDAGSDVGGRFVCTGEYSKSCQWAIEKRGDGDA
jgi:hypothetical protein